MKSKDIVVFILLFVQLTWAPTCGMGSGGALYHIKNLNLLGLPVQASSGPVISIFNANDNSLIEANLRYYCYSEFDCTIEGYHFNNEGFPIPTFENDVRVLLKVNDSGSIREYYADLRYNASGGGRSNCGGPAYSIENITPVGSPPFFFQIFIVLVLIVAICVGLYLMRKDVKKSNRKSKID